MEKFSLLDFVSSTNNVTFAKIHRLHIKEATFSGGCCVESLNQERVLLKLNCGMKEINTGLESRFFTAQGGLSVAGGCRCLTKDGNTSIEKEGYIPYPLQA